MTKADYQFKIESLQRSNQTAYVQGIFAIIFALFVIAILPSLILIYFYKDQQLFSQPPILEYIPTVAFSLVISFVVYLFLNSWMRSMAIKKLENDMKLLLDEKPLEADDISEIKSLVQEVLNASASPKSTSSKPKGKRSASKKAKN